ncbi:MAG: SDH family Clp fold serine proteinase [Planctomycetota bacterium]|jgi:ATP-dependent protease ClpP protease subunit
MAKKKTNRRKVKSAPPASVPSPWERVNQEVHQTWELRKALIQKIESRMRAKVIVYFTSFMSEDAMISDQDAEMIEHILSAEHKGGKVVLILSSAGGSGLAAERIVNVCRAYSDGQFEVIVPHSAKSAATLICFGAFRIRMSATAELGPVDPQLKYVNDAGEKVWISAEEYVRSYDQLMDMAVSGKAKRLETLLQQLVRYDARHIEQLRSAQALSESISVKLLRSGMMSHLSEVKIKERIAPFLIQEQTISHGRMITIDEANKCGLRIREIKLRSRLWQQIWELYVRASFVVSTRSLKILESNSTSLGVAAGPIVIGEQTDGEER